MRAFKKKKHDIDDMIVSRIMHGQTGIIMGLVALTLLALLLSGCPPKIIYPIFISCGFGSVWFCSHSGKIGKKIDKMEEEKDG